MGSIKEYFSSVGKGIKSLVEGMTVTGKELVTPKVTECYPENRDTLQIADRFRAELTLIYDKEGRHKCIACGICQMNCPNGTINLTTKMVELPDGKKKRKLDKYMYDLGSCTFCMLCVTTCPQDALEFSNDFEQAVFRRETLVKQLNYLPEAPDAPAPAKPSVAKAAPKAAPAKSEETKAASKAAPVKSEETKVAPKAAPAKSEETKAAPKVAPAKSEETKAAPKVDKTDDNSAKSKA